MMKLNENAEVYETLQRKTKWHRKQDRKLLLKAGKKLYERVNEFHDELINAEYDATYLMMRDFHRLFSGLGLYRKAQIQAKGKYVAETYPENEHGKTVYANITLVREYAE